MDEDDRTTGSLSWALQLQRYFQQQQASGPALEPALLHRRKALLDALQQDPAAAEPWAHFLDNEEGIAAAAAAAAQGAAAGPKSRASAALGSLYQRATQLVPRARGQASEAYMRLWVGYARHQW